MAKKKRNPANAAAIAHIFENYEIKSVLDIQEALKDMFGGAMEQMLAGELDSHLGYGRHENATQTTNRRNGASSKIVRSQLGELEIDIPRDREASFEPQLVPKHQKDVSGIEDRVLAMYAKGQSQRDITATIQDIYGFNISPETVSKITDRIIPLVQEFRNRALKKFYPFVFVDAMYTPVKTETGAGQKALYNMIGIDVDGCKDVLGFWLSEDESSRQWIQILEEIKQRGVEDILFISLDGLKGLEDAIKTIYPQTTTQRCIVHLMRNSTRYIPRKRWAEFAKDIKAVYKAVSLDEAAVLFESFQTKWAADQSAVKVWSKNWDAVARLFELPAAIRKIIYTTNTIESYHNQLRKVTNGKGSFPSEMALFKLIYLRINEIRRTWDRPIQNWGQVLNQLVVLYGERVSRHIQFTCRSCLRQSCRR